MGRRKETTTPILPGRTQAQTVELEQFARRLHELMIARGLSQSDLARAVWGSTKDQRGYNVARNRDRISVYLKGLSYPERENLDKLAKILGTTPEDLAPDLAAAAVERTNPALAIHEAAGHPDKVYLRVNKLVPLKTAAKVIALLSEEP